MKKKILIILIIISFPLMVSAGDSFLEIKERTGLVQVQKSGQGEWTKVKNKTKLITGDMIRTFLESSVLLVYPDESEFRLGENSLMEVKDLSQNPKTKLSNRELKLHLGAMRYKVTPFKEKGSEFKIHSSTAIVGITGTEGLLQTKGQDKESKNILIEGETYNTDSQGENGSSQKEGDIYSRDEDSHDEFSGDVQKEADHQTQAAQELRLFLRELVAAFQEKKNQGYLVSKVENIIEEAFALLEKGDYARVDGLIEKAFVYLEKAKKPNNVEKYVTKLDELRTQIEAKEKENYDVVELYLLLGEVVEALQDKNVRQVEKLIALLEQRVASVSKKTDSDFLSDYQKLQELVLAKEVKGFSVGEVKELLRQSYIYYQEKNHAKAYSLLKEADEKLHTALKEMPIYLEKKLKAAGEAISNKEREGYDVVDLKLKLEIAFKLLEAESFLKLRTAIEAIESALVVVKKNVPLEWERKIQDLIKDVEYKKSLGYELGVIYDHLRSLKNAQKDGNVKGIEEIYEKIKKALAALALPAGFKADWQQFLKHFQRKRDLGFDIREVKAIVERIKASVDKGDVNLARSLLAQAKQKLKEVKDAQPPVVQVMNFSQQGTDILVEGLATDNTEVSAIFVNGCAINFAKNGEFVYKTSASPKLDKLTIVAQDIGNNQSPPLEIKVEPQIGTLIGAIENAAVDYKEDHFILKGKFIAGGKIETAGQSVFCDESGLFQVKIIPDKGMLAAPLIVKGQNLDQSKANEVSVNIEDKWKPIIEITNIVYTDNLAPIVSVSPIEYIGKIAKVTGSVEEKLMATVEGTVYDLGLGIAKLTIFDREVETTEGGRFSVSSSVTIRNIKASLEAIDGAGNKETIEAALDFSLPPPVVLINKNAASLGSDGGFEYELALSREVQSITVEAKDAKGNESTPQVFPLSSVYPPLLEISSIIYEKDSVKISGNTEAQAQVLDESGKLPNAAVTASSDGSFVIKTERPKHQIEAILVALNVGGKKSEEVRLKIEPLIDERPPTLYLSQPVFDKGGRVIISGSVEDDTGIESLLIAKQKVELEGNGRFYYEIVVDNNTQSIEVLARDLSGKETKEILALEDTIAPEITIDIWEVREGKLIISGKVRDNVAVKGIEINGVPIIYDIKKVIDFNYEAVLTEHLREVSVSAVDIAGNQAIEGPRKTEIPEDKEPPELKDMEVQYHSRSLFVSGRVQDSSGIKGVYVLDKLVDVSEDGAFKLKLDLIIEPPQLLLEEPLYIDGQLSLKGKVSQGLCEPLDLVVEAQDLWGNKSKPFAHAITPYAKENMKVFVAQEAVAVDSDGAFESRQVLSAGTKEIEVKADDPYQTSTIIVVELENNPPLLEVGELEYLKDEQVVVVSGKAVDGESGLASLMINGVNVDFGKNGEFSHKFSFTEGMLTVTATDYIGSSSSVTKEITPPDMWPPIFVLEVKPLPAIIGNPVYVEINSIDSQTNGLDIVAGNPAVTAVVDGKTIGLSVEGEGAQFIARMDTEGLSPALVEIQVQGQDEAGNKSSQTQGATSFTLTAQDNIVPSFSIEVDPSPLVLGVESNIKVFSSEALAIAPELFAQMPAGESKKLDLVKVNERELQSKIQVPLDAPLGEVVFKLNGGEDLSGNPGTSSEKIVGIVPPQRQTDLPLSLEFLEFNPQHFIIRGLTATDAVVHLEYGEVVADIMADAEGKFAYNKPIDFLELSKMHEKGAVILVKLKAKNYAGLESMPLAIEVPLPLLITEGAGNFKIDMPRHVAQGAALAVVIEPLKRLEDDINAVISFPDGRKAALALNKNGRVYNGQYVIDNDSPIGRGMVEVASGQLNDHAYFEIGLSSEWLKVSRKDDFYALMVMPDPITRGEGVEFVLNTLGDLEEPPKLDFIFSNGKKIAVALSGGGREFRGKFACPKDVPLGMAQLILNPATPDEVRRRIGVWDESESAHRADVFLTTNPTPLVSGASFNAKAVFSETIDFVPQLQLRLNTGKVLNMPVKQKPPLNSIEVELKLAQDVPSGMGVFVVKDDQGMVLDTFPTRIVPSLRARGGAEVYIMPGVLRRMQAGTIQLNSRRPIKRELKASLTFADGRKLNVVMQGAGNSYRGNFVIPDYASSGMVIGEVYNDRGDLVGAGMAEIIEDAGGPAPGGLRVWIEGGDFGPKDRVVVNVESDAALFFKPEAKFISDQKDIKINLKGAIPGNRFQGEFNAPEEPTREAVIEVYDDRGNIIGDYWPQQHGPDAGGGRIMIEPMPPMIGQPLTVKVVAPGIINFRPRLKLIFDQGSQEPKLYGAIPGDMFSATLPRLESPLETVEISDQEGNIFVSMPVEFIGGGHVSLEFDIELTSDLISGETASLMIRANNEIPFVPRLALDFAGKIVDVPLAGSPYSREFMGRFVVPVDAPLDNIAVSVFDPTGRLLTQRMINFGQESNMPGLYLDVKPQGNDGFELFWERLPRVSFYELLYGEGENLKEKIEIRGQSRHQLRGLMQGRRYSFEIIAYDSRKQEIMRSPIVSSVCGQLRRELHVQDIIMPDSVSLIWGDYPGADSYRVSWGNSPGGYANSMETSEKSYMLTNLPKGVPNFIKVFALGQGKMLSESREIVAYLEEFVARGVDIGINPEPAGEIGKDLEIYLHFMQDIPFVPQVSVQFEGYGEFLVAAGEKRDFKVIIPGSKVKSSLVSIDVQDDRGRPIGNRFFGGSGGGADFGGPDLRIMPDPPIEGQPLDIELTLPMLIPQAPKARIIYSDGSSKEYAFDGRLPGRRFNAHIGQLEKAAVGLDLLDPFGTVRHSVGFMHQTQQTMVRDFRVTPHNPFPGDSINVNLEFVNMVNFAVKLFLEYDDGRREEFVFPQKNVNTFYMNIDGSQIKGALRRAVIEDDRGMFLIDQPFGGGPVMGTGNIMTMPDPPRRNQPLGIRVEFPYPLPTTPKLILESVSGARQEFRFPQEPGLFVYKFSASAYQMQEDLQRVVVENETGLILAERFFGTGAGPVDGADIKLTPDMPVPHQDLTVHVDFPYPVQFTPKVVLEFSSGARNGKIFPQSPGNNAYYITLRGVEIIEPLQRVVIEDDRGMHIADRFVGGGGSSSAMGANLIVNPDPPMPHQDLGIKVEFPEPVYFKPKAVLEFEDGTRKDFWFSQESGARLYELNVVAAENMRPLHRIAIEDDRGGMFIVDRIFSTGSMMSAAANINVMPDPPIANQPLNIKIEFPSPVYFVPKIELEFNDGGRFPIYMQHEAPGKTRYETSLPASDIRRPIHRIEVQDDKGMFLGDRFFGSGGPMMGGILIDVIPDPPQLGSNLEIVVHFDYEPYFTPKIVAGLDNGAREFLNVTGQGREYKAMLSADRFNANLLIIDVEDEGGMHLGDRMFGAQTNFDGQGLVVNPYPPIVGQRLDVNAEIPLVSPLAMRLRYRYMDGVVEEITMQGDLPGSRFHDFIDPLTKPLVGIDLLDPYGVVRDNLEMSGPAPTGGMITVNPDPPMPYQDLNLRVELESAAYYHPIIVVEYSDGSYTGYGFPQDVGDTIYQRVIPGGEITKNIERIAIKDEQGTLIAERLFGSMNVGGPMIDIMPNPPIAGQDLIIKTSFPSPIYFVPKLILEFTDGQRRALSFPQGVGLSMYEATIPSSEMVGPLHRVVIEDDRGMFLGDFLLSHSGSDGVNIMVMPDPPVVFADLNVRLEFSQSEFFKPQIEVEFDNGTAKRFFYTGEEGRSSYDIYVAASEINAPISRIAAFDDKGGFLGDRPFSGGPYSQGVHIMVNPDPPIGGQDLGVRFEFPSPVYFTPKCVLEFSDGQRREFWFPQGPGLSVYETTISANEVYQPVDRIAAEDDRGMLLGDIYFGNMLQAKAYLASAGSGTLDVSWDYIDWASYYEIWYGTAPGNYNGEGSPKNVGQVTEHQLTDLTDGQIYYAVIKAYDANGGLGYTTLEEFLELTGTNIPYPNNIWTEQTYNFGEIIVRWDYVSGVDGYKIYYGRSSRTYPDFVIVSDPSITRTTIGGLQSGVPYYITVTCTMNDGSESSYSPREVEAFATGGASGGSINITTSDSAHHPPELDFEEIVVGQDTETKTITLQNLSSHQANIKVELSSYLSNTTDMITQIDSSNINLSPASPYAVAANSSLDISTSVSIPSTGVTPGEYVGEITFYDDEDDDGIRDDDEYWENVQIFLFFGAEGLDISGDGGLDFMNYAPGSTTSWGEFTLQNTATTALNNIITTTIQLYKFTGPGEGSFEAVAGFNVEADIPSSLAVGASDIGRLRVVIPDNAVDGEYGTMVSMFNDTNSNGSLDTDEPLETIGFHLFVSSAGGGGHRDLEVGEASLNYATVDAGASAERNVNIMNNMAQTIVVRIEPSNLISGVNTISSNNITFVPISIEPWSGSVSRAITVSVPSSQPSGAYTGGARVYGDLNGNGLFDDGEPFDGIVIILGVSSSGSAGIDLNIQEESLDLGGADPNQTSVGVNITIENNSDSTMQINIDATDLIAGPFAMPGSSISNNFSPFSLDGQSSDTRQIAVTVLAGQASAVTYQGGLIFYNDTNSNGSRDNDEAYDSMQIQIAVNRQGITSLTPIAGTGGTVDLVWSDPNAATDHYNVYWVASPGAFDFSSPDAITAQRFYQVSGLTASTTYDFLVRSADDEDVEDNGVVQASETARALPVDTAAPTFAGVKHAYAPGAAGTITLEWNAATDSDATILYDIDYGETSSLGTTVADLTKANVNCASDNECTYGITGLSANTEYHFRVRAEDSVPNQDTNAYILTAKTPPATGVDHVGITAVGSASSSVGDPVMVKLTAWQNAGETIVATNFADSIIVDVIESSSRMQNSWLLSVRDRMTGGVGEVAMFNGVGYFTVDSLEPETITVSVEVGTNASAERTLNVALTSVTGAAIDALVSQGPGAVSTNQQGQIWLSAIDNQGNLVTDYAGIVNITVSEENSNGSAVLRKGGSVVAGSYSFTGAGGDNGEILLTLENSEAEEVNIIFSVSGVGDVAENVNFLGVDKLYVYSGASFSSGYQVAGTRIRFTAYSGNDASGVRLGGYNATVNVNILSESTNDSSSYVDPSSITFVDGIGEFALENSQVENVKFQLEDAGDATIKSAEITVSFQSSDTNPPEVLEAVAETPYLVHVYFDEDIDSDNAQNKDNYNGIGDIHTVCWYEDNVTLHLSNPLTLGGTFNLDVRGDDNGTGGIKDKDNNYISGMTTVSGDVPSVDYQGGAISGQDWYEVQPATLTPLAGETVSVVVYHKNACGYLSGTNAVNRTAVPSDSSDVTFGGTVTGIDDATVDMGSAEGAFQFVIPVGALIGQTVTITVDDGAISGDSPTITVQ
ncbi:MAG: hypothetical protein GY858_02730 [Candidatus Omnitrophica bacterium]|nr:hypothetical protein [Candidatus Omnitrophota bacterium]